MFSVDLTKQKADNRGVGNLNWIDALVGSQLSKQLQSMTEKGIRRAVVSSPLEKQNIKMFLSRS